MLLQGGEIDFLQYLEAVERTQFSTFLQSSAGRAQLAKTGIHSTSNTITPYGVETALSFDMVGQTHPARCRTRS